MEKKIIPSASEVREYLEKEDAARKVCIKNGELYVITGSKFPGENIEPIMSGKRGEGVNLIDYRNMTMAGLFKGVTYDFTLCWKI